jgi:NAD(P)-dependent dehydrogenase (short-subunit alcohol dehydrogenase family)
MILKDKVSIITGGSQGIGKAIARAFAREGSHIVINARTAPDLQAAKREIEGVGGVRVEIFPADVSRPENAAELIAFTLKKFGNINTLVNCAGIQGPIGLITDIDNDRWLQSININLFGTFLCIKAVLPVMMKNGGGKIINFSGGGSVSPRPRFSAYSASKAAVVRLTETIAEEVKDYHIYLNAVAPGAVNTRLLDEVLAAGSAAGEAEMKKALKQKSEGGVPPEEVAELAIFLASTASDGLSGRLISLPWDDWKGIPGRLNQVMSSDVYAVRRIVPKDRGYDW